jgi:hypothetical protein
MAKRKDDKVTINGKTMWWIESELENGDVRIFRYVNAKNKRYQISQTISPTKLKKWGK